MGEFVPSLSISKYLGFAQKQFEFGKQNFQW